MIALPDALAAAVGEVESPTWMVTRQYLAVHRVAREPSGEPRVARIDQESQPGEVSVYFDLHDLSGREMDYHLVVRVEPRGGGAWETAGVWIEPFNRVSLAICSETVSAEEISKKIGVPSTRSAAKGEPRLPGRSKRVHTHHLWSLGAMPGVPGTLEEKIGCLRKLIGPSAAAVASFASSCEIYLSIGIEDWAGQQHTGVHFDADTTRWVASLAAC